MNAQVTMTIPLPKLTPELMAKIFWEMDDGEQAKFFDELGTLVMTTPTPFTREIGSMFGLDMQMHAASLICTPLGRDTMARFSDNGFLLLNPLWVKGYTGRVYSGARDEKESAT